MDILRNGIRVFNFLKVFCSLIYYKVQRDTSTKAIIVDVSSREALDVNLSSSFVELALSTANVWNREGDRVLEKARGSYAPYRIVNRTGGPLFVWSDPDGSKSPNNAGSVKIEQGAIVDWRFDDWKRMREVLSLPSTRQPLSN